MEVTGKGNIMYSSGSLCPRTRSGVIRVNCDMDSGNSSYSRTRSGLVRGNNIMDSSDGSCSRTRSGLVRRNSIMGSGDGSCSRTRSGLVRGNIFMDSSDSSCSRTRSGIVRESPLVVKTLSKDEAFTKGPPDGWMKEDMSVGTRSGLVKALTKDEAVTKGLPDGWLKEEMASRTLNGLVRGSPNVKREDKLVGTRSGLVRGSPDTKTLSKDEPIIKGLADGWLKEDKPLGTRSGLVRGNRPVKVPINVEPITKRQSGGWLKEDMPAGTRSSLVRVSLEVKTLSKDESIIEGLPDGWRKEYRPRKNGSSQKNDPYYIDPISGYEFRSLKDVHRYLQTGDIQQCAMRPKKGTIYDVCITEDHTHRSTSSQHTRPGTADKAIQCEILTSEGIKLPWEELCTPDSGKNTELTMSPESESMKLMRGYGNGLETLENNSVQPVSAQHAQRQTKSVKRKKQNVEVKSKKRKTSSAATPVRVSPRLAALNVQHEVSIEPEDQPNSVNLVNQVQTIEENTNDRSQTSQSDSMNQHGNQESTFNQLWTSRADTANGMQENTTDHLQPRQVDTVNHMQTIQENTAHELQSSLADTVIPIQTMQEYTIDQPSQADTVNHIQTNKEDTFHELQLSLADTVFPVRTVQEYTTDQPSQADTVNHVHMNQENTANQLQSGLADTVILISAPQESPSNHSRPSSSDSMNQIQANQENTANQLQLSEADTVTQIQMMQENMTKQLQMSQADTMNQIDINLEITTNHLQQNYAENHMLQAGFSWVPEQNGAALITDFWNNVENQDSSVPIQIDGAPVASFPENVKFQTAMAAEPVIPTQAALPGSASDQSGSVFPSLFGNTWSDPCIEFAFKTLTGDIPILDDTAAVTDYFPQQQDLNKGPAPPNCLATAFDSTRNHTQVDVNFPLPRPSDKFYNGSWFPPQ